ncbi:hypothetical protein [Agarivorans sp.]|uniref:hypothetical protein n=1 Tax=Agarivorans sp. TaxID=1872412 RepID=UPI003CFFA937
MSVIKQKTGLAALAVAVSLLAGCATSPDDLLSQFATNKETSTAEEQLEAPVMLAIDNWYQDPVFAETDCDSLSSKMVTDLVARYTVSQGTEDAGSEMMLMYTLSSALVNRSMLCISQALDLKDTTEQLLKEREILLSGSSLSRNEVEEHRLYSEEASDAIRQAAAEVDELQPEQRKSLVIGIATFLAGGYATGRLVDSGIDFAQDTADLAQGKGLTVGNLLSKVTSTFSGGKALYTVTTGMPEHVSNLYETGTYFIDYAHNQDLDLPEDATSQFMKVGAWL